MAGWLWLRVALLAVAAAVAGPTLLAGSVLIGRGGTDETFLAGKLGAAVSSTHRYETAAGDRVALPPSGYELHSEAGRLALASADRSGGAWRRHERGAVRATFFGAETVVVAGDVVEQFLTVTERTGPKRWRWRLETGTLDPTLRSDGSVLVSRGNLVAGFRVLPAAVLDADGDDVTPTGVRWELERRKGAWWLALDLDDRELPLPYVIDPATITVRAGSPSSNAGATTLVVTKPAGLAVDDQMIAQVTVRGGTGIFICAPAGWTSVDRRNSTTTLAQEVFRKTAVAADVAAANFTFTFGTVAGCSTTSSQKASGGIIAYYGVDNSSPISGVNGQANASSVNIAAPTVTPGANDVLLGVFGTATATTIAAPTGSPTFSEGWDIGSTSGAAANRTTSEFASALSSGGATGTKTAVAAAAAVNIGQLVSLKLDATAPTAPAVTVSETDTDTHASGTTLYYRAAGDGGTFSVSATATDGQSGLRHISFPGLAASFTPTSATNDASSPYAQSYSWTTGATESGAKTVTAEDNATNQSTGAYTITPDNAVPVTGALTVNGTAATGGGTTSTSSGSFSISRTDYTDGGSGLVSSTLTRDSAPYTNGSCGAYSGSPTTLVGAPAQNLTVGCYRYVLTGVDNVGNTVSIQTDVQVHGAAAQVVLTGSTANLTSGATRVLTATLNDANGNTVVSDNSTVISFGKQSGAGTVTGTGTATASSGVATKTISGALTGAVTMEATASGLTTGTLGAFTVLHGAASQIALTGSTADLTSGATRVLTATIRDAAGNTVTSDSSTVVTFAKQSGIGNVSGTGTATAASGVATKTITGALAGSVVLEATATGLTTGTLGAFTVVHGAAAQIALTGSTADLTSGATRVLTATIRDAAGNTVTGDSSTVITFAQASGSGSVTGTGTATAATGVATKTVTGALAGSVTMEATATGLTTGTLGSLTVVHGAAADIVLAGSTADLASGATRVLTATLKDAAGNTVTSDNSTVTTFGQASGTGSVAGTGTATASSGVATKIVTGALAGTVTMEATAIGLTTGTLGSFTVVAGAAAKVALTAAPSDLTSGSSRLLTATVQDAGGNTITGDNATVVTFAQVSGAGTVTGLAATVTVSGGVATKTVTGELAGSVDLEASATGVTTGTLSFDVVHGAAAKVTLSAPATDLASGAGRVLTATVRDAAGNPVTNDNSTVVTFAKDSGTGTVSGLGTDTAAAGVATKTVTGVLAGSVTLEASAAGLLADNLSFDVVAGAATQLALSGSTADLGSGATRVLTATIQDAAGNPVTADNTTVVTFAKQSGTGTVAGAGTATAAAGVATKTVTGALVGAVVIEVTAAGLTNGTLGSFTVVHGAAAQIALSGSTADLTSGATRLLTATVQDAAGNTVTADNSTVVAFGKQSGAGTVSGTGTATASSGVATKTVTGALVGTVTMEATATGLTTGTLAAFTVLHGAAAQIELTHSGSTASGDNHTLTATVRDAAGNTVSNDSSTVVTFAKTSGTGTVTGLGTATASNGIASKVVVNAAAGAIDLDAQAAGLATGTASYVIAAGIGSTLTSTIAASPTSLVANGTSTSTITVSLRDAAGNDLNVSGGTVALGLTGAGSLSAATDNGDGSYTATLTSPTTVGSATVTGTLNGSALAATAGVTYTHGPATGISLTESGSTAAGNAHTLTATIEDANGNAVTSDNSTVVTFARTSGPGTVTGLGSATASSGVATRNVTNMLAGQIDLDAQATGLATGTTTYTITTGPVSAAASDSTVVAAPTAVYANGTDTATITVTLRDAGGNGIAGKTVTLAQGAGGSTITGGGATNVSGTVTFSVSDSSVETVTYTATDTTDAITLSDDASVDFTFSDATPPTNTVTLGTATRAFLTGATLYYNGAAGGSFTLSSAVADGGAGPSSASYPVVAQPGWTHGAETVSTPAGGPYVSTAFTFAAGASGDFPYGVTANDAWTPANSSVTTLNVTEDATAPSATILCEGAACSAGWYTASPVTVTLGAPDAGAGLDQIRYTIDGTDPTVFTGNAYAGSFTVAAEGVTTVKYRAFDRIGNDTGVLSRAVRIDTVAPDTTLDSTPAAATQDTTPTFAFSSPEPGTTFATRLDGGSWSPATNPLTLGPLAENTYTLEVRATDVAGNVDASPASFTFTVDTTAADTSITSSPPAAASSASASFSFTASDAGPGFECRLDGGAFADCSSPASYTGLTEAAHTFEVRAEDAAGNLDPTPATYAWTIDLTAPNTSFLATPVNPSPNPTPTFTLGSTDTPATFECNLDGGGWAVCATPLTTPALGDGSHTLQARARDAAGNTDASAVTFTWLVDATAPTGSITSPADGADLSGTVALTTNSADSGSGIATVAFQRAAAGTGAWAPQGSSWDTTLDVDGDWDLRVITTDNAGNSVISPAISVTVDNTDPNLSVSAPNPVNLSTADPATVSATASDAGTGIANIRFDQCAEDSPACLSDTWVLLGLDTGAPYQASWPIPSDGPRLIRVRATDNAGRQKTELVLVTVDRTRPDGSLTSPTAGADLRGANVGLAATASDTAPGTVNTVTFQRSPAGAGTWSDVVTDSTAPYAGTFDTTAVTDGLYDLRVFTTDAAGNAEATPGTIQVRVDNTLPTGLITAPADAADIRGTVALTSNSVDTGSGVATVVFQRSPAGAGTWTNQPASWNTTGVADGEYDVRVVTTDNAGNVRTSPAITVRVDNTEPTGAVTAAAGGANVRGTITLSSDSADAGSGVDTVVFQRSPAGTGTWTNQAASWNTTLIPDGLVDLRVVTADNAGNSFASPAVTVRVDNTAPTGSITAPANSAEIGVAPVALTSNSADAGSGVATVVFERTPAGAGTWTATPASWNTASGPDAVADGDYDLRVTTTDNAGNALTSATVTIKVDHTAPTTSAGLTPGSPSNAPVTVTFTASDGTGSGVSATSYSIDGGALQLGNSVIVAAPGDRSNDGTHVIQYFSTDDVGNVETPKTVTVVIDTTAPSGAPGDPGTFLRGIANLTYSTGAGDVSSVQFQFSPAGAGAWSNVGAADLAPPYDAAWNTTLVADGPYDLRAVVTDTIGNVANELLPGLPKTVDNTAPSGSVAAPAAGAYLAGAVGVDATATDGVVPPASGVSAVRFEVKPAGAGAFSVVGTQTVPVVGSTYRQTLTTTALADGPADLRVVVTDAAGNETTSATRTISVDNDAPVVTLDDPGAAVGASVGLGATSSADTASVTFRYRAVGDTGAGTVVGADATAPFGVTWTTAPAAEQQWELIAVATDAGGNVTTSAPRTVLVDRTQPTGAVTAPANGATLGGPAVVLAASAVDTGGSGVVLVEWQVQDSGAGSFSPVATDSAAPYDGTWNSTSAPDGAAQVRARIVDAVGNERFTAAVTVTVDSTGPTVTLADPGAVLSGTAALSATTGGGATRVTFAVSPADAGTWTQIGEDTSAPFSVPFDATALADGLYDLRAIGYDSLGNASTASLREDVRLDNTAPWLVSTAPADGSTSSSANQIVLTASEPVTAPGALLDGAPAPAPTASGNQLTFATGTLADGLHVLEGELQDASGTRVPFRVAVTLESSPSSDPQPVERNMTSSGDWTLTVPGGTVTVRVPQSAWPTPPTPQDYILILRVDAGPAGTGFVSGMPVVEVTARWAIAGTYVNQFDSPIEIVFSGAAGTPSIPAYSTDGSTWQTIAPVDLPLPASRQDGFSRSGGDIQVWTRHLTYFGLMLDNGAPSAPRDFAGVVDADGLTLRWAPGGDASGQMGNFVLFVNGESYREFGPTEFEAKLGPFAEGDTRTFRLAQFDAAGNLSPRTPTLRALPSLAGLGLAEARAALDAAGFSVGTVTESTVPNVLPGAIVPSAGIRLELGGTPIDLVVAQDGGAPQTRLAFTVVGSRSVVANQPTLLAARINVSKPAQVTAVLRNAKQQRLHTWRLRANAGATIVKLRLPARLARPATYTLTWIARSGAEVLSRTSTLTLVNRAKATPKQTAHAVLMTGHALTLGRSAKAFRVSTVADADRAFEALAAGTFDVVVADADLFGTAFVADLRRRFPDVRVIAVSREPARRTQSRKAGAVLVLPRFVTAAQLAKAIARIATS